MDLACFEACKFKHGKFIHANFIGTEQGIEEGKFEVLQYVKIFGILTVHCRTKDSRQLQESV